MISLLPCAAGLTCSIRSCRAFCCDDCADEVDLPHARAYAHGHARTQAHSIKSSSNEPFESSLVRKDNHLLPRRKPLPAILPSLPSPSLPLPPAPLHHIPHTRKRGINYGCRRGARTPHTTANNSPPRARAGLLHRVPALQGPLLLRQLQPRLGLATPPPAPRRARPPPPGPGLTRSGPHGLQRTHRHPPPPSPPRSGLHPTPLSA